MAQKTQPTQIIDAIKRDFHTYLRKGVRLDSVVGDAHPDLDISDIESLLRVHFLLTEDRGDSVGVIDFVERLPEQIRRLKTTTTGRREAVRGQIRGHIDWSDTLKHRSRIGQLAEPIFVCLQREEHYDIKENLVLKRLLTVIKDILGQDLGTIIDEPEGFEWLGYWTAQDDGTAGDDLPHERLQRLYRENIYLQRISVEERDVTDRMIESVKRSRSRLYGEAATLLDRYRRLMRHQLSDEEARAVLNHTMIAPEAEETLFELYWIFRVLNSFDGVEFQVIRDRTTPVIASWEDGEYRYTLYHDSTGDNLTFREDLSDNFIGDDGYLLRLQHVLRKWQELNERLLGRQGSGSLWGGRPDIVLEKTQKSDADGWELAQVFVGEVKYSNDSTYAAKGLRELLEYMAFVRKVSGDDYVEDTQDILTSELVRGLLFLDKEASVTDYQSDITIVRFGEDLPQIF